MKTLQDLVDKLNKRSTLEEHYFTAGSKTRDYHIGLGQYAIVSFNLRDRTYSFTQYITVADDKDQDLIVKYLANHTPDDWFAEKKYNIIIGQDNDDYDETEKFFTAYYKQHNAFYTNDSTREDKLSYERYIFTESEIDELKSTLPENMQKIVDLGKVELKDD